MASKSLVLSRDSITPEIHALNVKLNEELKRALAKSKASKVKG